MANVTDVTSAPEITATEEAPDLSDHRLYFNREVSWMQFNERVNGVWYFNPASAGP